MNAGADMISMVKTNTKGLCKNIIEKLKKYWTGGSHLVLKIKYMLPRDKPLIDIGYKYNYQKVLYSVGTEDSVRTKYDIPYLCK